MTTSPRSLFSLRTTSTSAQQGDKDNTLFIVADRELEVAGDDTLLLVVARRITRELKDLGREVLEHSGEVD
jgi:hypothetical protein